MVDNDFEVEHRAKLANLVNAKPKEAPKQEPKKKDQKK